LYNPAVSRFQMPGFASLIIRYLEAVNVRSCPSFLQRPNFFLSLDYLWPLTSGVRQQSEKHDDSTASRALGTHPTIVPIHAAGTHYLVSGQYFASTTGSRSSALGLE
jgi:hypothetical protein